MCLSIILFLEWYLEWSSLFHFHSSFRLTWLILFGLLAAVCRTIYSSFVATIAQVHSHSKYYSKKGNGFLNICLDMDDPYSNSEQNIKFVKFGSMWINDLSHKLLKWLIITISDSTL